MVRTRNPLNIGAAARAMSNFGFFHLRLVNPYEPSFREARSAVGASTVLADAEVYRSVADAVADCSLIVGTTAVRHRELQHPLRLLESGARLIRKRIASSTVALLFGSEKVGLSNADISHCHWLMCIPTHQKHISMNLGQAVAVCLYELVRGAGARMQPEKQSQPGKLEKQPAKASELERITVMLLDALCASGYLDSPSSATAQEKVRRMVRRLNLPTQDAEVWLGMFRQMVWKMRSEKV
jgi:TrmH family RNA methyltransferase